MLMLSYSQDMNDMNMAATIPHPDEVTLYSGFGLPHNLQPLMTVVSSHHCVDDTTDDADAAAADVDADVDVDDVVDIDGRHTTQGFASTSTATRDAPSLPSLPSWWVPPSTRKTSQNTAKSTAAVLLLPYDNGKEDMSVNSLLKEHNRLFESCVPEWILRAGLRLGSPQHEFLRAVILATVEGISDRKLRKYGLHPVIDLRNDRENRYLSNKNNFRKFFSRRRKGTTQYVMNRNLLRLIDDHDLPWPGRIMSAASVDLLRREYSRESRKRRAMERTLHLKLSTDGRLSIA